MSANKNIKTLKQEFYYFVFITVVMTLFLIFVPRWQEKMLFGGLAFISTCIMFYYFTKIMRLEHVNSTN